MPVILNLLRTSAVAENVRLAESRRAMSFIDSDFLFANGAMMRISSQRGHSLIKVASTDGKEIENNPLRTLLNEPRYRYWAEIRVAVDQGRLDKNV